MIPLFLIAYFCSKSFIIGYLIFNYILSVIIYCKAFKYYFPLMISKSNRENNSNNIKIQNFHENYPSFSRTESCSISFGWIFFGMVNYFWIKAVGSFLVIFCLWVRMKIHFFGRDILGKLTFQDKQTISDFLNFYIKILIKVCGIFIEEKNLITDHNVLNIFKKYLGDDYDPQKSTKFTTIISNHVGWIDILYHIYKSSPSFVSKSSVKKVPFIGYCTQGVHTLYIDRTNENSRHEIMTQISDRQKEVLEEKSFFPVAIYPESTTTNGRSLITFKKGAFITLSPIKIFLFKINNSQGSFSLAASSMKIFLHLVISFTFLKHQLQVDELPIFEPTDFLFKNFKHLGKDKVEIYSEACRHLMSEISGFPISTSSFDSKLNYISEIKGKIVKNT